MYSVHVYVNLEYNVYMICSKYVKYQWYTKDVLHVYLVIYRGLYRTWFTLDYLP